jgi:hypothetical protein
MTSFSDAKVDVSCPECGRSIRVRLRDIKHGRLVTCAGGHRVQLEEQGHGIRDADRAVRDLERSLEKLGGKLKFRL